MNPQTLLEKQELMRARYEQRRPRKIKPVPHPDAESLLRRAQKRLEIYKMFVGGLTPAEIAKKMNHMYGLDLPGRAGWKAANIEDVIAQGFRLPKVPPIEYPPEDTGT
jgi:hypothetical protein